MTIFSEIAMLAYIGTAILATTTADRLVTIGVAAIGAAASLAAAWISRGNRAEIRNRRVIVTRQEGATTITNEEIDELEDGGNGG